MTATRNVFEAFPVFGANNSAEKLSFVADRLVKPGGSCQFTVLWGRANGGGVRFPFSAEIAIGTRVDVAVRAGWFT